MASVVVNGDVSGAVTLSAPSAAGTVTVTLPSTSGTMLTTASTGVVTQAMLSTNVAGNGPAFSAYANANQSVTSGVATKITLNVEDFDTASAFDSTTNYRFTPQVAGYYQINCTFSCGGSAFTSGFANLYKNGSTYARLCEVTAVQITMLGSIVVYLNGSTDYLELYGSVGATSPTFDTAANSNGLFGCRMSGCLVRSA